MRWSRAVVTGGAGFIGSEVVRQLTDHADSIIVVDNLKTGRRENLSGLPSDRVKLAVADFRDDPAISTLLKDANIVFHLACLGVRHSIHSPIENHEVNATGTIGLLRTARSVGVGRFVHVSSSEVYGTAHRVPMAEDHPTEPTTPYGASKLAGEAYARCFERTYGFPTVMVRPFNTYGPRCHHEGDSGEVIPRFLLRCMAGRPMVIFGDGSQTRDFLHVSDAARGILQAGWTDEAVGKTINLGTGREIAIRDLAREIATFLGKEDTPVAFDAPRPGDVLRLCADAGLARQTLDFHPKVGLREGIRQLHDWYVGSGTDARTLLEQETVRNWEMPPPRGPIRNG